MEVIIQWVVVICLPLITILLFLIFYQTSGTQNVNLKVWEEIRKQNDEYRERVK
jgi:hypothetical protein